jgi:hypothetical protein
MGKFKPARPKKGTPRVSPGALPCVILVLGALMLFSLIIYGLLSNVAT